VRTNGRQWTHTGGGSADVAASSSTTVAGVLITKVTAGQPSTNINGTATTDALRRLTSATAASRVDTTNNRGYFVCKRLEVRRADHAVRLALEGGHHRDHWRARYAAATRASGVQVEAPRGTRPAQRQSPTMARGWASLLIRLAATDLAHWVETLGVDDREADLVDIRLRYSPSTSGRTRWRRSWCRHCWTLTRASRRWSHDDTAPD